MAMTKREKQAKKYIDPYRKEAVGDTLKLYQQQAQDTRKTYDNAIFETGRAYEDDYRENAVQKAINERQVAESMANMGLTDSGLNRTQATAVQLSYGNNKAAIDRAKRQAQDSLELEKTGKLSTIRQNWLADKASINQTYDKYEADYAASLEDADAKRYAASVKNQVSNNTPVGTQGIIAGNNQTLSRVYLGNLEDNNVSWYTYIGTDGVSYTKYTDTKTGKSSIFRSNTNPYTGTVNYDTENGVWSNTKYQPTNITVAKKNFKKANGTTIAKGDWIDDVDYKNKDNSENLKLEYVETTFVDELGRDQNVFKTVSKTSGTKYWMWDDSLNRYLEVYKNKKTGKWDLKQ